VVVMYAGKVVETAPTDELFANPRHPYTLGLLASVPRLDEERPEQLKTIEGAPPDLLKPPPGCPFMPRCAFARSICKTMPPLDPTGGNARHLKACWVDVTDPAQQAYAERRRQARLAAQRAALAELAETTAQMGELASAEGAEMAVSGENGLESSVASAEVTETIASVEEAEEK